MAEVLIAGAGIGGLATALALQRQGQGFELWEQASALGEVGAGREMPGALRERLAQSAARVSSSLQPRR